MVTDSSPDELQPDKDSMLLHIEHLFGCASNGRIHLAWTDPGAGAPKHGCTYDLTGLEELVEDAARLNAQRCNVFICPALMQDDAPVVGRCKDEHFQYMPAYFSDIDEVKAAEAALELDGDRRPTMMVITGRKPGLRLHLYWKLEEAEQDPAHCRLVTATIAQQVGGDPAVINPSRLMRLGGSVAWPTKKGRVAELTEVQVLRRGR